jgi:CheY-like chemotaxis protein
VVRCRYLPGTGRLHEVGLRFETPLEVALMQRSAADCRVLLGHDDPTVHQIVPRLLSQLRVRITSAASSAEALRAVADERFDIVLLGEDWPGQAGGLAVGDLRASGFARPIFALTTPSDPRTLRRCLDAGFTQIASQPLTRDSLGALIKSTQCEPLVSARANDQSLATELADFVSRLPDRLSQIEVTFASADSAAVRPIVRRLRDESAELGFEVICTAAEEFDSVLATDCPTHARRDRLSQLSRLAHAAQAAPI